MTLLHASRGSFALCDGSKLDATLTSESPECRGMLVCRLCLILVEHQRRERRRG